MPAQPFTWLSIRFPLALGIKNWMDSELELDSKYLLTLKGDLKSDFNCYQDETPV